jgi:hypothetical protein
MEPVEPRMMTSRTGEIRWGEGAHGAINSALAEDTFSDIDHGALTGRHTEQWF